jgi:hypothetical protein
MDKFKKILEYPDKEIMKRNIRNGKIQVNSRKIWKSTTSGRISGEKYQVS